MAESTPTPDGIVGEALRLGAGFHEHDRRWVLERLAPLGKHLARWDPDQVDVEVSVKDRDGDEQQVTLEASVPRWPHLVARAAGRDLDRALVEARKELIRQIDEEKRKREVPGKRHGGRPSVCPS
jgi:ribosome-associated translation inhibitor RaiA